MHSIFEVPGYLSHLKYLWHPGPVREHGGADVERERPRDRGAWAGEAVRRPGGPRRDRLRGGPRDRVRAPRAQRRRQDDGRPHPHDDPRARRGHRRGARVRRRPRRRTRSAAHRAGRSGRHGGPQPHRPREPAPGRAARATTAPVGRPPGGRAPGAVRALAGRRPTDQDVLGRDAAPARRGRRPGRTASGPVPRRAHDGPGPPEPERALGDDPRPGRGRHHRAADDAVPGGGGSALRTDPGRHARARDRRGDAVRAQGAAREHRDRIRDGGGARRAPRGVGPDLAGRYAGGRGREDPGALGRGSPGADGDAQDPRCAGAVSRVAHRARAEPGRRLPPTDRTPRRAGPGARVDRTRSRWRWRMSQAPVAIPIPSERRGLDRLTGAVSDSFAMTWRNVITLRRVPQLLGFSTVQPVIFVLLFVYVFGGAVQQTFGLPYVDYLIPGIFVQMAVFGAVGRAVGRGRGVREG